MHDALPLVTDLSRCANAVPKIFTQEDIPRWLASEAYRLLHTFITRLNAAVHGKTIHEPCVESNAVRQIVANLDRMNDWIDQIPLQTSPQRFGNKAFRDWTQRMEQDVESTQKEIVPTQFHPILPELIHHFRTSFGSAPRLDYGTGHELSFLAYLLVLRLVGILTEADEQAIVTRVFVAYLNLVRRIQSVYRLEPAGSKGVWGLDDHQHLVYIWGASQLKTHPTLRPISVLTPSLIEPEASSYLFLSSILHIRQLKTGPFAEHSPMLNNIASTVPNWTKVNTGLLKMYEEEVLKKVPVVQHFWFGGLLAWRSVGTGEVMESSGDGKEVVDEVVEGEVKMEGTKAPWATDSSAIPSQPLRLPTTTLQSTRRTAPSYTASRAPQSFNPPPLFPPTSARSGSAIRQYSTLAESGSAAASSSPFGSLPPPTLHSASKREGLPWERK